MRLDDIPRIKLADLPTPMDEAPTLAKEIGISRLFIKRDDLTGLALGGNKARKLEFLMADALALGADIIITCGGGQSNHARMTAAAARKLGLECIIFLNDPMPETFEGNLLLDTILGSRMRFLPEASYPQVEEAMAAEAEKLAIEGLTPYVIPVGGSTQVGAAGYVMGVQEAAGQLKDLGAEDADIVVAMGSGGTLAGMSVGCYLYLPESKPIGISVSRPVGPGRHRVEKIAVKTAAFIGLDHEPDLTRVGLYDEYIGEAYGIPTEGGKEAILMAARTEGLILDPVYTGKAMAGLIDLGREGVIGKERPVVFWHTGGAAGLFAYHALFHDEALRLAR